MKNNFLKFFIFFLMFGNIALADQFIFETSTIDILDNGNLIVAEKGKASL